MTAPSSTMASASVLVDRQRMTESERWRYVLDNSIKSTSVGFLATALLSLVAFRSVPARVGLAALGAGFGAGRAYVDARFVLGHDVDASVAENWEAVVAPSTAQQAEQAAGSKAPVDPPKQSL